MKIIAMIPARLGSKRIPKKNIRLLEGKPLLAYAIDVANEASCFDEIWVNSESDLIGELAREVGASFYKRPAEFATDTATNQQFTADFLKSHACDFVVMVNPTSPLLRAETVRRFVELVRENNFDTILSVLDEYAESFVGDKPINFSTTEKVNSQNLDPVRKTVWALTAWRRSSFLDTDTKGQCGTFHGTIGLFTVPKDESCDLDTPEDWEEARAMLIARRSREAEISFWEPSEDNL